MFWQFIFLAVIVSLVNFAPVESREELEDATFPECGRLTPASVPLRKKRDTGYNLPWVAAVYTKKNSAYNHICLGTLIATKTVVTASHCFTDYQGQFQPANEYAIAVGKKYSSWDNPHDNASQKFKVHSVLVPDTYVIDIVNFKTNIALAKLETPIIYNAMVQPACLDFSLHQQQLQDKNKAKVPVWKPSGNEAVISIEDVAYVGRDRCVLNIPLAFVEYITTYNFCVEYANGSSLCRGSGGAGVVFPEVTGGVERYYLQGILFYTPPLTNSCETNVVGMFTNVSNYETFIKQNQGE